MVDFSYKNYRIESQPHRLQTPDRWTLDVTIYCDTPSGVKYRSFSASSTYATREAAVEAGLQFGKNIIEGRVPNCSVEDL